MERRVIDMEKDPRREQFQLFSGYSFPYAGVTVQLDVTALELRLRAEHKPIFLTMLYVIHRAVNRVPELRRRIEDGQVVEYDECPVSFTEMKPDGSYAYCRLETALCPVTRRAHTLSRLACGALRGRFFSSLPLTFCILPQIWPLSRVPPASGHNFFTICAPKPHLTLGRVYCIMG